VASRIAFDGRVWKAGRDVLRATEATGELEAMFGLTRTKGHAGKAGRKGLPFAG
jgi:hypothetical protein